MPVGRFAGSESFVSRWRVVYELRTVRQGAENDCKGTLVSVNTCLSKRANVKCIGPTATKAEIEHWKDEVLFSPQLDELAEFLNLVGNSTRLKIVFLLTEFKELCVCDLAEILDITVPAVSQQLAKLKAFGLLKSRRENQTIFYSIADTRNVKLLKGRLEQIIEQSH
jgi:ArsR family transcriptional regulator, lead/cadmium/zinc/bismuth-responsive transcriptional repressor